MLYKEFSSYLSHSTPQESLFVDETLPLPQVVDKLSMPSWHTAQEWQSLEQVQMAWHEGNTFYPEELQQILRKIRRIEEVERFTPTVEISKIAEKPFAIDLADEDRTLRAIETSGGDTEKYWQFFRDQIRYYSTESYTNEAVYYQHSLVNDEGHLRLWIDALGKSAKESYVEGAVKADSDNSPQWYRERARREAASVDTWEEQLQQHLGHKILVEISPGPYDVDEELLKKTTFRKDVSFVRLHQLIQGSDSPHVLSFAKKIHLQPTELSALYTKLTGKEVPPSELLGTFLPLSLQEGQTLDISDIQSHQFPVFVQQQIESMLQGSLSAASDSQEHVRHTAAFTLLENDLRQVFDIMKQGQRVDESRNQYLHRAVQAFQNWEKQLQAHVSGRWEDAREELLQASPEMDSDQIDMFLSARFVREEYKPAENSCGSGVGASAIEESISGFSRSRSSTVISGASHVYSGAADNEFLTSLTSKNEGECVTCPYCKNKKNNKKVKGKWICGSDKCPTNSKD